jgi:hypothetical protein
METRNHSYRLRFFEDKWCYVSCSECCVTVSYTMFYQPYHCLPPGGSIQGNMFDGQQMAIITMGHSTSRRWTVRGAITRLYNVYHMIKPTSLDFTCITCSQYDHSRSPLLPPCSTHEQTMDSESSHNETEVSNGFSG